MNPCEGKNQPIGVIRPVAASSASPASSRSSLCAVERMLSRVTTCASSARREFPHRLLHRQPLLPDEHEAPIR
ncbi:MAG: hypothetical protein IPK32_14055 [Verrucomicrobiaceae bacterium]|nr:hypothetical protein [Verrucomicrobiaceae bacterium]